MKQKKPIIVVALVLFWIGYVTIAVAQYFYLMSDMVEQDNLRRFRHIDYEMFLAGSLLATGEVETLIENLDASSKTKEFDFYVLKDGSEVLSYFNPNHSKEETAAQDFTSGTWMSKDGNVGWRTIQVRGYSLTMGIQPRGSEYILRIAADSKWGVIPDIIIVTAFFGLLIYFVLKDILDLTRIMQTKSRDQAHLVKVRTKEAEVLVAVTSQYEQVAQSLKLSNKTFADSLSPAVRYELSENTPVPHLFDAVVVRIDVNGYTQMFLEKKDEFVTSTLNQYFQVASEMINRYGGHIYQFVGDEIVFHFKSADFENPLAHAASCVRSLFEVAALMNEELEEKGVPFVVKASMCSGRLRFIKLDTGFAFAGLPLIESVRMLGKIEERDHNILAVYAEDYRLFQALAQVYKTIQVSFKGFTKQSELIEIKDFVNARSLVAGQGYEQMLFYTPFFRSDADLVFLMKMLMDGFKVWPQQQIIFFCKIMKSFAIERVSGGVVSQFDQLLEAIVQNAKVEKANADSEPLINTVLSSVVSLAPQFLKAGILPDRIRFNLEELLQHKDGRVRGNTILALDEVAPESYSFRSQFSSHENRAAADALLAEGRREYTVDVHKFLKSFLKSRDPFFVASGLYVLTTLYKYHETRDPVYFSSNQELKEIPALISNLKEIEDPMVSRRRLISMHQLSLHEAA